MTDIVELLREDIACHIDAHKTDGSGSQITVAIERAAAAEIERLRDDNALLRDTRDGEASECAEAIVKLHDEIKALRANRRCAALEGFEVGNPCVYRKEVEDECARLRGALSDIVRRYEFRSELFIDDATCAGTLYDTARIALRDREPSDE